MYPNGHCRIISIAKKWKQPKYPSIDEWIIKLWYIYTMEYYLVIEKNAILPFATVCIDRLGIILNEISQSENNK